MWWWKNATYCSVEWSAIQVYSMNPSPLREGRAWQRSFSRKRRQLPWHFGHLHELFIYVLTEQECLYVKPIRVTYRIHEHEYKNIVNSWDPKLLSTGYFYKIHSGYCQRLAHSGSFVKGWRTVVHVKGWLTVVHVKGGHTVGLVKGGLTVGLVKGLLTVFVPCSETKLQTNLQVLYFHCVLIPMFHFNWASNPNQVMFWRHLCFYSL